METNRLVYRNDIQAEEADPIPFYLAKGEARGSGLVWDEYSVAYPRHHLPGAMEGDVLVQRCFAPLLIELDDYPARELLCNCRHTMFFTEKAETMLNPILNLPSQSFHLIQEDNPLVVLESLRSLGRDIRRILVPLSVYERLAGRMMTTIGPERLACQGHQVVTSGSQAGVSTFASVFAAYWSRFLDWHGELAAREGGACAVSLDYVQQLGGNASLLGLLMAIKKKS